MRRFKIPKDPWDIGENLYTKTSAIFTPGLTVLVGCNGSGKTTLLRLIEEELRANKIPVVTFNNLIDGGSNAMQEATLYGDITFVATAAVSSEGENIFMNLGTVADKIGTKIRKHPEAKEIWVLLDAVDSGLSVDNIVEFKDFLKDIVIKENKDKDIYILASANGYELCNDEKCFDVRNGRYMIFDTYDEYRAFILGSRVAKDKRIEQEEK